MLCLRDADDGPNRTKSAIWIGTNDLGPAAFFTDNRPNLTILDFLDCVYEQLDMLYETGARNFIILNVAPLNYAPQYALPENGGVINTRNWLNEDQYSTNVYVFLTRLVMSPSTLSSGCPQARGQTIIAELT